MIASWGQNFSQSKVSSLETRRKVSEVFGFIGRHSKDISYKMSHLLDHQLDPDGSSVRCNFVRFDGRILYEILLEPWSNNTQ